jgi:hypothetical protein
MPEWARPAHMLQGAAIELNDRVDGVVVRNCRFTGLFDAIDATEDPRNLHIHHNEFHTIRDDVLQLGTAGFGVDFHDNLIRKATVGVSYHGSGAAAPSVIGTKFIHHNVIDTSTTQLYGRDDPAGLLPSTWRGPLGDGMATGRAFGDHESHLVTGPDPWKIYCNTVVVARDVDDRGAGQSYEHSRFDPAVPHEVYNNIFVQMVDHHLDRRARVADGSQIQDGNLYFLRLAHASSPLFQQYDNAGIRRDFVSLSQFLASGHWTATRASYPAGWEAFGVQGDPGLDASYRPAAGGPAASGAIDLRTRGWPGTASAQPWRGALPPR